MTAPFRGPRQRPPWSASTGSDPFPDSSPDLPLNRYDHRRLTARDVLVHRLMAEFMTPSPPNCHVFGEIWDRKSAIDSFEPPSPSPLCAARHRLLLDLQVLERLLHTTTSQLLPSQRDNEFPWDEDLWGPNPMPQQRSEPPSNPRTVGEHLLDLVLRHYFELDDMPLRVCISRAAPPTRMPEGPGPDTASRARSDARRCLEDQINRHQAAEGLAWGDPHVALMRQLRQTMAAQPRLDLYDGGILLPQLRRDLESFTCAAVGTKRVFSTRGWTSNWPTNLSGHRPRFIHANPHAPAIEQPSWDYRVDFAYMLNPLDRWNIPGPILVNKPGSGIRCVKGLAVWIDEDDPMSVRDTRRSRCVSEPPDGRFADALLQLSQRPTGRFRLQFMYPRMALSQLDGRSRRRSLSRTRIDEMFDWGTNVGLNTKRAAAAASRKPSLIPPCGNCHSAFPCTPCLQPCGHCGAPSPVAASLLMNDNDGPPKHTSKIPCDLHRHANPHLAPDCPVAPRNRCKCIAFPTLHTAAQCPVPCRGGCGNPAPLGSLKHRNAMTCRARCCMCGLRGHSGRECRLARCRCGGAHLGQDCGWNPTCRVQGCDRFLCGVHCRECGSTEKPFVGWRCRGCLGFEGAGEEAVEGEGEKRGRGRRRRKGRTGDRAGEAATENTVEVETVPAKDVPAVVAALAASRDTEPERESTRQQSLFGDPRTKNPTPRAGR